MICLEADDLLNLYIQMYFSVKYQTAVEVVSRSICTVLYRYEQNNSGVISI